MQRFRPFPATLRDGPVRRGAASMDMILLLGVVLPILGLAWPLCWNAIQASFAWSCRVVGSPCL